MQHMKSLLFKHGLLFNPAQIINICISFQAYEINICISFQTPSYHKNFYTCLYTVLTFPHSQYQQSELIELFDHLTCWFYVQEAKYVSHIVLNFIPGDPSLFPRHADFKQISIKLQTENIFQNHIQIRNHGNHYAPIIHILFFF